MTLIACLLALVVLILLFGAGAVRNGIMAVIFAVVGGGLAIVSLVMIANLLGENGLYIIGGVVIAATLALWLYGSIVAENEADRTGK